MGVHVLTVPPVFSTGVFSLIMRIRHMKNLIIIQFEKNNAMSAKRVYLMFTYEFRLPTNMNAENSRKRKRDFLKRKRHFLKRKVDRVKEFWFELSIC